MHAGRDFRCPSQALPLLVLSGSADAPVCSILLAAMSEENVRIVQALVAAHQRGDFAAVFAAYDPEIEWRIDRLPEYFGDFEPVYRGHDGVKSFWRVWFSAWEDATFEYEQFIDAGDSVVSILTQRMRGRTSGLMAEWRSYAQVWALRDGKVIRVEFFATRDAALEAVGVRD